MLAIDEIALQDRSADRLAAAACRVNELDTSNVVDGPIMVMPVVFSVEDVLVRTVRQWGMQR